MKVRDSGMPEESVWDGFFSAQHVLRRLGLTADRGEVVEVGCGYGTFTIPAAKMIPHRVYAFDIDPEMIAATQAKANAAGLANVQPILRDVCTDGTGLADSSAGYAMLFNILHAEEPMSLLCEMHRVLALGGTLAIIHWRHDPTTPRGPSLEIRPRPDQCITWARAAGFEPVPPGAIELPPYHYGVALNKTATTIR